MITDELFKTEDTPRHGTTPDQIRHETTWYEFGGLGQNKYTLAAHSDKVAIAAILLIGGAINSLAMFRPRTSLQVPDLHFSIMADTEFTGLFGHFPTYVTDNMMQVEKAIMSAGLGTIEMREGLEDTLKWVRDTEQPGGVDEYLDKWTKRHLVKGPHLTNSIKVMQLVFRQHALELAENVLPSI